MKRQTHPSVCNSSPASKSSRDAVETAIDLARGDTHLTWEGQVKKALSHIPQWEEDHSKCVEEKDCIDK